MCSPAGLHPPSTATTLRRKGDDVLVTGGPFAEGREHVGGFSLVEAPDLDGALEWGRELAEQDRSRWDAGLVAEGQALVRRCLRRNTPGPYQVQAAIQAVHGDARTADTDWPQIVALYDLLLTLTPSPVVALHRAVAVAEARGPAAGLSLLDGLDLPRHHLLRAARADLLRRLGRNAEAAAAYGEAIALAGNAAERAFLERRRAALTPRGGGSA